MVDAFSTDHSKFPPMEYMIESNEIPTQQDDINDLNNV